MPNKFERSVGFLGVACTLSIILYGTVALPARAQDSFSTSGGDCFSSSVDFYCESAPIPTPPQLSGERRKERASSLHAESKANDSQAQPKLDPFAVPEIPNSPPLRDLEAELQDPFAPRSESFNFHCPDAICDCWADGTPQLQGATGGTIGPQGRDITCAVKQPPGEITWMTLTNLFFSSRTFSKSKLRMALCSLDAPSYKLVPAANAPIWTSNASLSSILSKITAIEEQPRLRVLKYHIVATVGHGEGTSSRLWGDVYREEASNTVLASLYARAATLTPDSNKHHIYLATAACYREDWDTAWLEGEKLYSQYKDDPAVAAAMADVYRKTGKHDLERCIWLTRYLRIVPTWESFEQAYNERYSIEAEYTARKIAQERGPDLTWSAKSMPLRICFPGTSDPNYDRRLCDQFEKSMRDWSIVTGGKIDFVETSDPAKADILCVWAEPKHDYCQFNGLRTAPHGIPELADGGLTEYLAVNKNVVYAKVTVYAYGVGSGRIMPDEKLLNVCYHEAGHALGIEKHLKGFDKIMNPYCDDFCTLSGLSCADEARMTKLYEFNPINAQAVEKFIGLSAVCLKLDVNSIPTSASSLTLR